MMERVHCNLILSSFCVYQCILHLEFLHKILFEHLTYFLQVIQLMIIESFNFWGNSYFLFLSSVIFLPFTLSCQDQKIKKYINPKLSKELRIEHKTNYKN